MRIQTVNGEMEDLTDALAVQGMEMVQGADGSVSVQPKMRRMGNTPNEGRPARWALPLVSPVTVATTLAYTLSNNPGKKFKADRLVIGVDKTGVSVSSINIGSVNQLVSNTGAMPAELFSSLSADPMAWEFSLADASQTLSVGGTNNNSATCTIFGAFVGLTIG